MIARLAELDWIEVGGDVLYRISGGDVDAVVPRCMRIRSSRSRFATRTR
jgi:hypothetical protein